jgi:hypothetical protein
VKAVCDVSGVGGGLYLGLEKIDSRPVPGGGSVVNRIAVLQQLGYLKTIDIPWRASALVTATAKGARARADLTPSPRAPASPVDSDTI